MLVRVQCCFCAAFVAACLVGWAGWAARSRVWNTADPGTVSVIAASGPRPTGNPVFGSPKRLQAKADETPEPINPAVPGQARTLAANSSFAPSSSLSGRLSRELSGRRIPKTVRASDLRSRGLPDRAVPLPEANTLAHLNFERGNFGHGINVSGDRIRFNPEMLLVRFKDQSHVAVLRVEPETEESALHELEARPDVQFAELDVFQQRQFAPNDPGFALQWHHATLGSAQVWEKGLEFSGVRVAIVDTPFQMDHPDLVGNVAEGWDAVVNTPVLASPGIAHSTLCAGLIAATINNGIGGCGLGNHAIVPININGAISEMYNAVIWSGDHGVRVVNISWTGGDSGTLQIAAEYLKATSRGVLVMAGGNGAGLLNYKDQPDIYCIAMTDAADNVRSKYGAHIDFAAPGWQIHSTTVGGAYAFDTGSSYATALFSGVVASLMGLSPSLDPADVITLLKATANDLGTQGRDPFFGWGRVNLDEASRAVTPDQIELIPGRDQRLVSVRHIPGMAYELWRASELSGVSWQLVTGAVMQTNGNRVEFIDKNLPFSKAFYQIRYASRRTP